MIKKAVELVPSLNEHQLKLFIEICPFQIAMFDTKMHYLAASDKWINDFVHGDRAILGKSHYAVFPEIPEKWKEIHRRCLSGATEKEAEDPFHRADGTTQYIGWEIKPWRDAQGKIGGIIMFCQDFTDRKEAQEALHQIKASTEKRIGEALELVTNLASLNFGKSLEVTGDGSPLDGLAAGLNMLSEELKHSVVSKKELEEKNTLFNGIIENIPTALFLKDAKDNFKITLWNKAAEEIFEVPREAVLGKTTHDLWPKKDADLYHAADVKVTQGGVRVDIPEESSQTKGRGTIWLHTTKVPLRTGGSDEQSYLLGICQDVTEEKKKKEKLENTKKELQLIADNFPGVVTRTNQEGRYTFVNKTYQEWLGKAPESVIGRTQRETMPPIK